MSSIQPINDDEQREAESVVPGARILCRRRWILIGSADFRGPVAVFDEKLIRLVEALQTGLLEYMKATTRRSGIFRYTQRR